MSNEDNLFGIEDLDDTRGPTSAEQLQATPMSAPPKGRKIKAKFNLSEVPRQAPQSVKVYDRYGKEQTDVVEFDPETFQGKRIRKGEIEDCYLYNGYVVAGGVAHPNEEELPQIMQHVEEEVKLKGKVQAMPAVDGLKTNLMNTTPESLRCPKCQSKIRFDQDQKAIVCTNGSCGMTWHSNGGGGTG